jgi:hypothetical protein
MKALGLSIPGKGPGQTMSVSEIQARLASGAPFEDFDGAARGAARVRTQQELNEAYPAIQEEILKMLRRTQTLFTALQSATSRSMIMASIQPW